MFELVVRDPDARGRSWLVLTGELDLGGRARLQAAFDHVVTDPRMQMLLLDLRGLEFIDVTSLGALVVEDARLNAMGRRVVIVRRGEGAVARLLELTSLDRHLEWVLELKDLSRPAAHAGSRHLRPWTTGGEGRRGAGGGVGL